jgi:ABC-type uncharacterized transport system permease subunit
MDDIILSLHTLSGQFLQFIDKHSVGLHVTLSTFAFIIFCAAALQACLLACQDYFLRYKRTSNLIKRLPPLETMELFLFRLVAIGFMLLTLVIVTSFLFFNQLWLSPLLQKTLVSLFAWSVFAILLLGRHYLGWRGRQAIRWTLLGVLLVVVVYFSSQLL